MSNITEMPLRSLNDDRPLPIIVSLKWDFTLATHELGGVLFYSIHDWITGITGTSDASDAWYRLQKQLSISIRELPYDAANGKPYQMPFANDEGLYKIAAYMRVTKGRSSALRAIKDYLAKAGVFTDEVRRSKSNASEKRQARYLRENKTQSWSDNRIEGIVERRTFTDALKIAVKDILNSDYGTSTDVLYQHLWDRTTAQLRHELNVPKRGQLRDHMGEYALLYTSLTEKACADMLKGNSDQITIMAAMKIVRHVARLIHDQAQQLSELLGVDLVTEQPLLPTGDNIA